jgi:transposase-like protein/IS1 family transposase
MNCPKCNGKARRSGKTVSGTQRFRCMTCGKNFVNEGRLDGSRVPIEKAVLALNMILEGSSVRSIERLTGVHRDTIISLMVKAGEKCEKLMEEKIQNVSVQDIQADELWNFCYCKERTKNERNIQVERAGDCWCYVAIERGSKLIVSWHLGKRTAGDAFAFTEKIYRATRPGFQLTTDGWAGYRNPVIHSLGAHGVRFGQLIKVYASNREGEQRYSPAECVDAVPGPVFGDPDPDRICTSHVERMNLSIRMSLRRYTRLTNAFSRKWSNLKAALALFFAWYNYCKVHSSIRMTPAMESGLTDHIWSLRELLAA